jgi:ABC-2 type transport system ATP-binding protein
MTVLSTAGATVSSSDGDVLEVLGLESERVAALLATHGLRLRELTPHRPSLEDAYMRLTADAVEYAAAAPGDSS